ncbi:MAG TPA: sigma 54-interacting transcriptional regulator, partial [Clostridia bacterium]|nr:sigma 54-interacting transcriptional regulator [Clostridia bacterium]
MKEKQTMTLVDLKDFLDTLVESFAASLEMELTVICTSPFRRVAATGFYRHASQQVADTPESDQIWKHSYTRQVIRDGKPMVVIDTSEYTRTLDFPDPEYYSLILQPILLMNRVEGVLVLASFNARQQQILLQKRSQYIRSLEKLAELIASKLEQQILLEREAATICQLRSTMETALNGLLLCAEPDQILQMNSLAQQYLHFENDKICRTLLAEVFALADLARQSGESRGREIHSTIGKTACALMVQAHPIVDGNGSVLCMIDQFKHVQDTIMQNNGKEFFSGEIIASGANMRALIEQVHQAARHDANILVLGESGTGKELFARLIHTNSKRSDRPFVSINCAAIPDTLLESELFGYEGGAFTGARKSGKIGKFLLANGGTLFLDEIGDMPLYLQAKILRVLSDRKVDRLGGRNPVDVDVRIVAATNRNLEEMIANREFREDLYYRLNVISFSIPPLRERREDIPVLIRHFIAKYTDKLNKNVNGMAADVQRLLMQYDWPGNVRELENCIEYMITFEKQQLLTAASLPNKLRGIRPDSSNEKGGLIAQAVPPVVTGTLKEILRDKEHEVLLAMNRFYGGAPSGKD